MAIKKVQRSRFVSLYIYLTQYRQNVCIGKRAAEDGSMAVLGRIHGWLVLRSKLNNFDISGSKQCT